VIGGIYTELIFGLKRGVDDFIYNRCFVILLQRAVILEGRGGCNDPKREFRAEQDGLGEICNRISLCGHKTRTLNLESNDLVKLSIQFLRNAVSKNACKKMICNSGKIIGISYEFPRSRHPTISIKYIAYNVRIAFLTYL
jgi:hypothetical protein